MELGITQSTDTHNKRSLIRTSHVCQRHRAAGRNQQVEGYKHTHSRVATPNHVPRDCARYLQTTFIMGESDSPKNLQEVLSKKINKK